MGVSQLSEIVALGFEELIAEGDTREIGKFLAFPTERIIAPQWLREECNIETDKSPDDLDGQQEKYDRLSSKGLRIQVKYRGGNTLHMEQTRRTTGKNANNGAQKQACPQHIALNHNVFTVHVPQNSLAARRWRSPTARARPTPRRPSRGSKVRARHKAWQ